MTAHEKRLSRLATVFHRLADAHSARRATALARADTLAQARDGLLDAADRLPPNLPLSCRMVAARCTVLDRDRKTLTARAEAESNSVRRAMAREQLLARRLHDARVQAEREMEEQALADWCDQAFSAGRLPQGR